MLAVSIVQAEPLAVGNDLQVLWDDNVIDAQATTVTRVLHHPEYAGPVLVHDAPWEGDGSDFHNILTDRDEKGARMRSVELFGNKVDRPVDFESGRLADFAGKPVTVEFEMYDADLYSFRFQGGQAE